MWLPSTRRRAGRPRGGYRVKLRLHFGCGIRRETEAGSCDCHVRERVVTGPGGQDVSAVQRRLRASQGAFVPKPRLPVIDELVATVLSQHTSDTNSERAFAQLKARFPSWQLVTDAPVEQVASAIRCGGIADLKARRIQQILAAIEHREGSLDLSRLHDLDDAAAEAYLLSLPGVGRKTAACVLAFSMGRPAFPVDTHVHRVAVRLGWINAKTTADRAHQFLAALVPPGICYDLHLAMITHGRTVCRARQPRCGTCVLRDLCSYGSATAGAGAG
jgi:endonuclease-3